MGGFLLLVHLRSMGKIDWKKVKTTIRNWKPGEYIRQTSIVVIGVLITFVGSELVTRCSEQKDIKSTMLLIRDELKSNRDQFEDVMSEFNKDKRISTLLVEHDMKFRMIPEDSLRQFGFVLGHFRVFSCRRNAIDLLKNSMLMQKISDKEFLLSLIEVYETLESFRTLITEYYDMKGQAVNPFHLSLTDEQFNSLLEGGYEMWEIYLSDKTVRNFMRTPMEYFHSSYKKSVEQEIDKMIQAIEQRYGAK